jgi:hypothetical protein
LNERQGTAEQRSIDSSAPHLPLSSPALAAETVDRLSRAIAADLGPRQVTDAHEVKRGDAADLVWIEANLWRPVPREEIRLRFNADTGAFMGWRHEGWFWSGDAVPNSLPDPQTFWDRIERMPLFIEGAQRTEAWAATDNPVHHEFLWTRYVGDVMVENDFVSASVNRATGRVAEFSVNLTPLDADLELSQEAAEQIFQRDFPQRLPDAVRRGRLKKVYLEIPGRRAKTLAWVASAIDRGHPAQIAVGRGGEVLRVDRAE